MSTGGAGTQTAALAFGGKSPITANTEDWNGVSWQETSNLNTARDSLWGAGTSTNALGFGGNAPPTTGATEEWSSTSNTTKSIDTD